MPDTLPPEAYFTHRHQAEVDAAIAEEGDARRRFDVLLTELVAVAEPLSRYGDGHGGYLLGLITERFKAEWGEPPRPAPREPRKSPAHLRLHRLAERDGWTCGYCGDPVGCGCDPGRPTACADHVVPRSRGGTDNDTNRVLACVPCNSSKGDHTPAEWLGL